jgi:hypothetical protein
MTRTWIVRLEGDDGTDLDGRLEVTAEDVRFAPGTRGDLTPAVVIRLGDIASSVVVRQGLTSQIRLVLNDGRRLSIDHGLRPIDELAEILGAEPSDRLT